MLTYQTVGYDDALRAIDAIVAEITLRGKAAVIAVADSHGELVAFARMDGAPLSSIAIATNKAWTAVRAGKPSADVGKKSRDPEDGFDISFYGDPRFCGWGGGVPVRAGGRVAGAVAVSGLPQAEDIELATMGAALIGK